VRPEDVRLSPDASGATLTARVVFIRDLGESVHYVLDLEGQEIIALYHPADRPDATAGDIVGVSFAPGSCTVLSA
jgi:putative spermidine/putrescine transport system ATP-binding protein